MPINNPDATQQPLRRRLSWPVIAVALLGGHATLIITAVTLAVGGTGRGVVPDYYQNAVHYDRYKADLATSAQLGWDLTLTAGSLVDAQGRRTVRVTLLDAEDKAIQQAVVHLRLIRLVDGKAVEAPITAIPDRPGVYQAVMELPQAGWYQADLSAELHHQRFVDRQDLRIAGGRPATEKEGV